MSHRKSDLGIPRPRNSAKVVLDGLKSRSAAVPRRIWGVLSFRSEARRHRAVKRREFITLLGGAAALPLAARAQQPERMRRIGVLMSALESDPTALQNITAFAQRLAELGLIAGRNMRIDYRWGAGDLDIALFAD